MRNIVCEISLLGGLAIDISAFMRVRVSVCVCTQSM